MSCYVDLRFSFFLFFIIESIIGFCFVNSSDLVVWGRVSVTPLWPWWWWVAKYRRAGGPPAVTRLLFVAAITIAVLFSPAIYCADFLITVRPSSAYFLLVFVNMAREYWSIRCCVGDAVQQI